MSRMVCEDEEISPLMRNFIRYFDSLTPEERKQEYEELKEYNTVGPKIVTNDMIEFKQKLIQIEYVEEVEDYLNNGWHITQISASNDGTCYVLLEKKSSADNGDNMICE